MTLPETSNPFKNGRIVGTSVLPSAYHRAEYKRGDPAYVMSRSSLMDFAACPKKWLEGWTRKESDATRYGSLMDCRLLMPHTFDATYVVEPKTCPAPKTSTAVREGYVNEGDPIPWNGALTFCKQWAKENENGREAISFNDWDNTEIALGRLRADSRIAPFIATSDKQVHVEAEYTDKETGIAIRFKTLIDLVPKETSPFFDSLADFKTARDASPTEWRRETRKRNYDVQGALNLWIWEAATGQPRSTFYHVISENEAPFMPARRFLSAEFLKLGQDIAARDLARYCNCLASDRWPDWDDDSPYDAWGIVEPEAYMIGQLT